MVAIAWAGAAIWSVNVVFAVVTANWLGICASLACVLYCVSAAELWGSR